MTLDVTEACSRITGLYLQEVTSPATTTLKHTTYTTGLRSLSGISIPYVFVAFWATLDYLDSNMKLMHVAHKLLKFSSQTGEGTSWVMQSNISCLFVSK